MTVAERRPSRLQCEALYPSQQERWPGRWIDEHGRTVHGFLDPVTGAVEIVDPLHDQDLPGIAPWLRRGVLVGYRPGRRAVVRLAGPPARYVKVVRPRRLAELVARLRAFDAARFDAGRGRSFPSSPAVVDHDEPGGWVVLAEMAGSPVTSWEPDATDWIDGAIAQALVALQSADSTGGGVPQHTDRSPRRWAELLAPVAPAIAEVAWRVATELPVAPEHDGVVLLHGDLHDGNIFLDRRGGIGLVDLDSLAVGHPGLDPANLAAHFVLRRAAAGEAGGRRRSTSQHVSRHVPFRRRPRGARRTGLHGRPLPPSPGVRLRRPPPVGSPRAISPRAGPKMDRAGEGVSLQWPREADVIIGDWRSTTREPHRSRRGCPLAGSGCRAR